MGIRTGVLNQPTVAIVHRDKVPGAPDKYTDADIEVVKGMLKKAIDYLGGIKGTVHPGDRVAIKVNAFLTGENRWHIGPGASTTDPRVVEALVKLINEEASPAKVMIVEEATAVWFEPGKGTIGAFKACGIEMAAKRTGAELVPLEEDAHVRVDIPKATAFTWFMCPKTLMDADSIIYVPKLKMHTQAHVTLGMKLSQGILTTEDKFRCHQLDIHRKFVDMLRAIKPDLVIIDGIWAQQLGEISPDPQDVIKDMNVIIAGKDIVATDAVGAAVMGLDPLNDVTMIRIAHTEGLGVGDLKNINVVGNMKIEEVKRPFKRAPDELIAVYPNVNVYMGGACDICRKQLRSKIDFLKLQGKLDKLPPINLIVGFKPKVPKNISGPTFVVGDCTEATPPDFPYFPKDLKEKGTFYAGCPPIWGIWMQFENDLAKIMSSEQEIKKI